MGAADYDNSHIRKCIYIYIYMLNAKISDTEVQDCRIISRKSLLE